MRIATKNRRLAVATVGVVLVAVACQERYAARSSDTQLVATTAPAEQNAAALAAMPMVFVRREAGGSGDQAYSGRTAAARNAPGPAFAPAASTMIIRNGDVSIQVDSVEASIELVRKVATSVGGYVGNVAMNTGEHQLRSATLELKVPAARFDEAMAGVRPIGQVERSTTTVEDVGEEFVDVNARMANARRLESRLVNLLANRTGKLQDVISVERELARVREEIERYEGRIRYLSAHIAMSTISVTVHEKPPLVASQPGTNVIGSAFVNMWRNFVGFVAFAIEALGVLIPAAALVVLGWLGWRWSRRRGVRDASATA